MFTALLSYIAGGARIRVRGLNLDRLLASLLKEGFVLRNLKRPSYQVLVFDADTRAVKKVRGVLKKQGYEAETLKEFGFLFGLKRLTGRLGLAAGFILCIAGVAVYNDYVWDIRIDGLERIKKSEVTELLAGMGVSGGTPKKDIDRESIAVALNTKLAEAANVTVQLKGTSLIVRIYETLFRDEVPDPDAVRHIVSACDAVVTNIVAWNGTAVVSIGDIVKKGEILIAGYNLDAQGSMTETRAAGEVTGKVFFTADNVFFTQREEYVRTGNYKESASLSVMGLGLKVKKAENPYPLYDKETAEKNVFTNMFIPIKKLSEKYWELVLRTAEYDYEAEKENVIASVRAEAEAKVPKEAFVVSAKTDIRQIDKYVITMYNIEARMLIGS